VAILGDVEPARPEQLVILGAQHVVSPDPHAAAALDDEASDGMREAHDDPKCRMV
jgi:hypothetical protein